ncbi:aminoglycoside phosphotransferase family protein [Legionella dresdenensis]|uniref:Aminoglycoside phosphotransferase family protein n=1 Tax=Legionella dresdenensis TaxID=450200 RepID=A0ABV8CGG5_9GAMM
MRETNIDFYKQRLNLSDARFVRIEHEDAIVAVAYKVILPSGENFILKIAANTQDYWREIHFLNFFAGKILVPAIKAVVPPETDIKGAVLMEYLPGTLLTKEDFRDSLAFEIGSQLGLIHSNRVKGYGDLTHSDKLYSDPRVPFTAKFEEGIAECSGHLSDDLLKQCRQFYDEHIPLLLSADGPCIIHRDFRPGNLIIQNNRLKGIIDWASARASFSEEDFCSMEFGGWLNDATIKEAFLQGYSTVRPVPDYQRLLPLLGLSKAIATIGFTVKRGTWNNVNSGLYQINYQYLTTTGF